MDVEKLASGAVRGRVLERGDEGYDTARRSWNARFEGRPDAVVRCSGAADVAAAIDFAREQEALLAVKGGGHSYAGKSVCDGGLLIDLSAMDEVRVDPKSRTARVESGAMLHSFDREAQAHGLAATAGACSRVGIGGLTLGGGTGYLVRKLGLTIDNLLAADVVTADGRSVRASEEENPDLFWALRGGGGNFGVVTAFEFQLHQVGPEVLAGQVVHRLDDARDVLRFYRDFMGGAADDVQCYAFFLRVPPLPAFPEEFHGQVALDLLICHSGPIAEGEKAVRPLRDFGRPILDAVEPVSYVLLQQAFDEGLPAGQRYFSRAHYLDAVSDELIDAVLERVGELPGAYTIAYLEPLGGAVAEVDSTSTAFPHRDAPFGFHILAGWTGPDEDERLLGWAREFHGTMARFSTGGVYVNLLGEDEQERVVAAYGENYHRLVQLKREWDPRNVFRVNHNIEPWFLGQAR